MATDDALRALLGGLDRAVADARALLDTEPPIDPPVDPVDPPVDPPVTGAVPVYAWCGGINASQLVNGESQVTAADLVAHGITGVVVIGQGMWWHPDYDVVFPMLRDADVKVLVGKYAGATPTPLNPGAISQSLADFGTLFARARAAGATACALDCEPYGYESSLWNEVPAHEAERFGDGIAGHALAQGFDELVMYCSSAASWPGSYNDLLTKPAASAAGYPDGWYAGSHFPNLLHALIDSGLKVTHTDAVFHHGPQIPGETWDSGAALTRECCETFDARLRSSIMFWPDIDEGGYHANPGYPQGVTTEATEAAHAHTSGPITIYQHHLTENAWSARWDGWLAEIAIGMNPQ